jgi:nitrogen fixation/metabolism regulation signal transduction histidine kinase
LAQFLRPAFKKLTGRHFDSFTGFNRTILAFAIGVYFVAVSASLGYRKEQNRIEVWANRLSVDRDITLELQLRRVEPSIANDFFISSLSVLPSTAPTILNRIVDNYMYSVSQDYDISVVIMDPDERDPALVAYFNERIRSGVKIHENSRFVYTTTISGHPRYTGLFTYFSQRYGVSYMLVGVEPKSSREYGGYSSLLDITDPGRVDLPPRYSYAKYANRNLASYKGNYPYPTILPEDMMQTSAWGGASMVQNGYVHFVTDVEDSETVIISRKKEGMMNYAVAVVFLAIFAFLLFSLVALTRRRQRIFETSYYKNRITTVLMVSLIVTLVTMAVVSVFFVYERNDTNKREMMSDKISSLQAMMAGSFRYIDDYRLLTQQPQELSTLLENARNMAKADITLYSPQGKAFKSTAPDVFDRMLVSDRMDGDAYENIVYRNARYFINRETLGNKRFYSLYAPLFNDNGQMVAILCSPYTDENYDFEMEAVMHLVTIISVFVILLLLARFMVSTMVDKMLGPIVEIGRKMHRTNIDNFEYIEYDRKDEISSLVDAYNLMVDDLAESTKQLAQAERDKAWSAMARQVAHEIKNPLTPMKLQLQRLIRLKQRGAAGWEDKFDEVAKVVLDHIDILTDTANEFSTFAKLYTEEPSHIDLDALLQEEISMFDNRDNMEFSYYGMEGASVTGPKPQLTRVFVNLITNSVQAIDIQRQEALDAGREPAPGRIIISLRNSSQDGYYDIVFEDNGPGVQPENQPKLFTPNFTTKSAGTGLGLAICRSILEKCGADITYSKSFTLEGACFTIRYPKE